MRELERMFREEVLVVSKMVPKKEAEELAENKTKPSDTVETLDVAVDDEVGDLSREDWG